MFSTRRRYTDYRENIFGASHHWSANWRSSAVAVEQGRSSPRAEGKFFEARKSSDARAGSSGILPKSVGGQDSLKEARRGALSDRCLRPARDSIKAG